jgi:hypothetical protein
MFNSTPEAAAGPWCTGKLMIAACWQRSRGMLLQQGRINGLKPFGMLRRSVAE